MPAVRPTLLRSDDEGLSSKTFEKLLAFLDRDRSAAGEKYELLRRKLIKFFEWRGRTDAEELADRTIDRVCRKIDQDEVIRANDPSIYFYGVARNILREAWTAQQKERSALESVMKLEAAAAKADDITARIADRHRSELQNECLDRCLEEFSPDDRALIVAYYRNKAGSVIQMRKQLSQQMGIPMNALRLRAHRIRARIQESVGEYLRQRNAESSIQI